MDWRKQGIGGILTTFLWLLCSSPVGAISLTLIWDPPENPAGLEYVVYISTNGVTYGRLEQVAETQLRVTGLLENEWYSFYVTSINAEGLESSPTDPLDYRTGLTGDVNDNLRFEIADVLLARIILEEGQLPPGYPGRAYLGRADLDDDGEVDAQDLDLMQMLLSQY